MPALLTIIPLAGYSFVEDTPCSILTDGAVGESVRYQNGPTLRRYSLSVSATNTERQTYDTFFRARTYTRDSFYWVDPAEHTRTGVALGTGNGVTIVYSIPSGDTLLDYPINDVTAVFKVNGTPATAAVSTDGRTFTASVAPANGTAVTCDYQYYRLVRLATPYDWTVEAANFNVNLASIELTEVYGE